MVKKTRLPAWALKYQKEIEQHFKRTLEELVKDKWVRFGTCEACDSPYVEDGAGDGAFFPNTGSTDYMEYHEPGDGPIYPVGDEPVIMCQSCEESELNGHASTAVFVGPKGALLTATFGRRLMLVQNKQSGDLYYGGANDADLQEAFETLQAFVRSQHWVRTDAWRGYVETEAPEAWQRVLNTWSPTVRDSGYRGKMELGEYYSKAAKAGAKVPTVWVFGSTSNVFSVGVEVYVRKQDSEAFLAEAGPVLHAADN